MFVGRAGGAANTIDSTARRTLATDALSKAFTVMVEINDDYCRYLDLKSSKTVIDKNPDSRTDFKIIIMIKIVNNHFRCDTRIFIF